jgi:ketosteroid isomerase-like protein
LVSTFCTDDAKLLPPSAPMLSGTGLIREFSQGLLDADGADVTLDTPDIYASGDLACRISQLKVKSGLFGRGTDYYIPASAVRDATTERVVLGVDKDGLDHMGWDTRAPWLND